mmetsp:Transcript_13352/g.28856  ORF Transcript_13352/g.28856 Transcript_13352/m.28856 type:complete len:92 (+) Transcript_13352:326-601(+)
MLEQSSGINKAIGLMNEMNSMGASNYGNLVRQGEHLKHIKGTVDDIDGEITSGQSIFKKLKNKKFREWLARTCMIAFITLCWVMCLITKVI